MALHPYNAAMNQPAWDIDALRLWIRMRFVRSPGPGGQNVNKVSTCAILLFDFERCPLLTDPQRERLRDRSASRLTHDGRLRIITRKHRTQTGNRKEAQTRLLAILRAIAQPPRPRRPTRPTAGSKRSRIRAKKKQGDIKRLRGRPMEE